MNKKQARIVLNAFAEFVDKGRESAAAMERLDEALGAASIGIKSDKRLGVEFAGAVHHELTSILEAYEKEDHLTAGTRANIGMSRIPSAQKETFIEVYTPDPGVYGLLFVMAASIITDTAVARCPSCKGIYVKSRKNKKVCSDRCRQAETRKRKREKQG